LGPVPEIIKNLISSTEITKLYKKPNKISSGIA
jgi:hypothetical protein